MIREKVITQDQAATVMRDIAKSVQDLNKARTEALARKNLKESVEILYKVSIDIGHLAQEMAEW